MKLLKYILPLSTLSCGFGQTVYNDLYTGRLRTELTGNDQLIRNLAGITLKGTGTPQYAIHISPGANSTSTGHGIGWGTDLFMYRSAASTLSLSGNLNITGTITSGGTTLVHTDGAYTWTGANTWSGAVSFLGSSVTVGTAGMSFTGSGASNTRAALALRPGTDVQAYSPYLAAITALSPTSGSMIAGNGTTWVAQSGSTLRTTLGLGTGNDVTFSSITASGATINGAQSVIGDLTLSGDIVMGATTIEVPSAGVLKFTNTRTEFPDNVQLGTTSSDTVHITSTLSFGAAQGAMDTTLYRSASNTLRTSGTLVVDGAVTTGSPIGVAYGGTGMNNSALAANSYLYTSGSGAFTSGTITAYARSILDDAADSNVRTTLGLGTSAVLNVAASGDAASGEVVKGNDTRLANSRGPSGSASGDLAGTYPSPVLANTAVVAGTYGSTTVVPVITVDSKGRLTGAVNTAIAFPTPALGTGTSGSYVGGFALADDPDNVLIVATAAGPDLSNPTEGMVHTLSFNEVPLGSRTSGNYVAGITAGTGITVTGSGTESAAVTIAVGSHTHTSAQISDATYNGFTDTGKVLKTGAGGVLNVAKLGLGSADAPTSALHIQPLGSPTGPTEGLGFGSDTNLYRSAANKLKTDDTFECAALSFPDATAKSNSRTALGVAIGSDVMAYNTRLQAVADLTPATGSTMVYNGTTWVAKNPAIMVVADAGTGTVTASSETMVVAVEDATVNLPALSTVSDGFSVTVRGMVANPTAVVTVVAAGAELIDAASTKVITNGVTVMASKGHGAAGLVDKWVIAAQW